MEPPYFVDQMTSKEKYCEAISSSHYTSTNYKEAESINLPQDREPLLFLTDV